MNKFKLFLRNNIIEIFLSFIVSFIFWNSLFIDPLRYLAEDFDQFISWLFLGKISFLHFREFPFYSSYIGGGFPLWANPQNMFFSLPQLLSLVFNSQQLAVRWSIVFLCTISMLGMFRLLKTLGIENLWCRFYGAIAYTFSGFFVSHLISGHLVYHGMSYIPWMVNALLQSYRTERISYTAVIWLALIGYSGGSFVGVYVAVILFCLFSFKKAKIWILTIIFAGLLSAPKMIASYELITLFPRNITMGTVATSWIKTFHIMLTALFWPIQKMEKPYVSGISIFELNGYIGIMCLIFIGFSIYYFFKYNDYHHRGFIKRMFIIIAVTSFFLYPGEVNPIWKILSRMPVFNALHLPMRFIGLFPLPCACLASIGLYTINRIKILKKWGSVIFILVGIFTFIEYMQVNKHNLFLVEHIVPFRENPHFQKNNSFTHVAKPLWINPRYDDTFNTMTPYFQENIGVLRFYDSLLGYSGDVFPNRSSVKPGGIDIYNTNPDVQIKWVSPSKVQVSVVKKSNDHMLIPINLNYMPGWKIKPSVAGATLQQNWTPQKWDLITLCLDQRFSLEQKTTINLQYSPSSNVKLGFMSAILFCIFAGYDKWRKRKSLPLLKISNKQKNKIIQKSVSIFIPVYNEEKRLQKNIVQIYEYLKKLKIDFEVFIVDDSSSDKSSQIAKEMCLRYDKIKLLTFTNGPTRRENLSQSFIHASKEIVMYMDSDIAVDLNDIPFLLGGILQGADIVIGSRYISGAKTKRKLYRLVFSFLYNFSIRLYFHSKIKDHQCGFKAFKKSVLLTLVQKLGYDHILQRGWFWDAELLIRAQIEGYDILEIPVKWKETTISSFRIGRELKVIPYMVRFKQHLKKT